MTKQEVAIDQSAIRIKNFVNKHKKIASNHNQYFCLEKLTTTKYSLPHLHECLMTDNIMMTSFTSHVMLKFCTRTTCLSVDVGCMSVVMQRDVSRSGSEVGGAGVLLDDDGSWLLSGLDGGSTTVHHGRVHGVVERTTRRRSVPVLAS